MENMSKDFQEIEEEVREGGSLRKKKTLRPDMSKGSIETFSQSPQKSKSYEKSETFMEQSSPSETRSRSKRIKKSKSRTRSFRRRSSDIEESEESCEEEASEQTSSDQPLRSEDARRRTPKKQKTKSKKVKAKKKRRRKERSTKGKEDNEDWISSSSSSEEVSSESESSSQDEMAEGDSFAEDPPSQSRRHIPSRTHGGSKEAFSEASSAEFEGRHTFIEHSTNATTSKGTSQARHVNAEGRTVTAEGRTVTAEGNVVKMQNSEGRQAQEGRRKGRQGRPSMADISRKGSKIHIEERRSSDEAERSSDENRLQKGGFVPMRLIDPELSESFTHENIQGNQFYSHLKDAKGRVKGEAATSRYVPGISGQKLLDTSQKDQALTDSEIEYKAQIAKYKNRIKFLEGLLKSVSSMEGGYLLTAEPAKSSELLAPHGRHPAFPKTLLPKAGGHQPTGGYVFKPGLGVIPDVSVVAPRGKPVVVGKEARAESQKTVQANAILRNVKLMMTDVSCIWVFDMFVWNSR